MSGPLIISDGSVAGVVACAIEAERRGEGDQPIIWAGDLLSRVPAFDRDAMQRAVRAQAEILGLHVLDRPMLGLCEGACEGSGAAQSLALMAAAQHAAALGMRRVVWGVQFGLIGAEPDLDRIASTVDRCLLISRLVSLDLWDHPDPPVPEVRVEAPLVDLSDGQLADLALDLGAPVSQLWWMDRHSDAALGEHKRWDPVLTSLGWAAQHA